VTNSSFSMLGLAEPFSMPLPPIITFSPLPFRPRPFRRCWQGATFSASRKQAQEKTAAFGLPLLQKLSTDHIRTAPRGTRALILAPTRDWRFRSTKACDPMAGISSFVMP